MSVGKHPASAILTGVMMTGVRMFMRLGSAKRTRRFLGCYAMAHPSFYMLTANPALKSLLKFGGENRLSASI
ncbi:hypothetical protein GCM10008090_34810 [Arenicella chitinivorans]|uniref:Uncharacterized protein n=1 Tax=Arenicella chitinivorans TaxID=1329800 RepID=A0A918S5Y3_9GAMM|nr:hypothetical protein GCM10008090_34810 [Arenicella chitinivorans]